MAKFPHIVIHNGVWYPAGTEVPTDSSVVNEEKTEEVKAKEPIPVVEEKAIAEPKYSKSEIMKMKAEEVKALAIELGFNDVEEISASELRRNIFRMLKL